MTSFKDVHSKDLNTRTTTSADHPSPHSDVIDLSSGDPHKTGMKPFSFLRQVLAACVYPDLLQSQRLLVDVVQRAQTLLEACEARSVGSYTNSSGMNHVRQSIAEFISNRDKVPCSANNVFISSGSQRALMVMVKLLASPKWDIPAGVLTPVPAPHTLPILLEDAGVVLVPYALNQDQGWAVDTEELHRAAADARGHCHPRAVFISNPGNPTGHVQERKSIQDVIRFAAAEGLLLLVDEVYQDYLFEDGAEFISYKKVLFEMGPEFSTSVQMVSFHSVSSLGECGLRAGYMQTVNIEPGVKHFVDTMLCTDISTPITGQLALDIMVNPPQPGHASYPTYKKEKMLVKETLRWNCHRACDVLNNLPGVSCQPVMGGIYLYPCVCLPAETIKQAKELHVEAGLLYSEQLMQEQAVLISPGFSQGLPPGSVHFRLCIMVPSDVLEEALRRIQMFHNKKYNM